VKNREREREKEREKKKRQREKASEREDIQKQELGTIVLLPDATLSHMVKECRKLFSSFLCGKKSDKKSRFSVV
jgi:hypothetical protein